MAGFGQAPVFGAQALSANAPNFSTSSPFGAPPTQSSPFGAPQQSQPPTAFGAPSPFGSNALQQPSPSSVFGAPANAVNGAAAASAGGGRPFGGLNTTNEIAAAVSNPFATAAASNPFGSQTQTTSTPSNPFGTATAPSSIQNSAPASNPFAPAPSPSPFAPAANPAGGANHGVFGQPTAQSRSSPLPFASSVTNTQKQDNGFKSESGSKGWAANSSSAAFSKPLPSFATLSTSKASSGFGGSDIGKSSNGFADRLRENKSSGFGSLGAASAQSLAAKGQRKSPATYATEILQQLTKDKLKPPPWPRNPGDPNNLKVMDDYRVKYKAYEDKVRASLIKAGLIDDPEVRKKLSDAIDFRGICEGLCPEGEKVSRIVEHDVKFPERTHSGGHDDGWANPDLMVKSFKRSAAGTDSPLPTEVRSPAALRRSLDYLINDLLKSDENLPALHGFLWDRTRAIRKDFIFQNAMTPEERIDQIYCLENITRFHAVSLHLLSRDGKEDFSEQQEREQLGKTLLSLMQVYDECKDIGIKMENEAEFRAYYLLFNAHDTFVVQQMQDWSKDFWSNSSEIQTAVTLIEAMRNVFSHRGPLRPAAPLTTGSPSFTSYFSIIESPGVSYTMACLAEIHFTEIRRQILKGLHRAYGRVRDGPKDLTAKVLNEQFRFDSEEECIDFLNELDMEFSSEGASEPYLVVQRRKGLPSKTIKQSFSEEMVEVKRGNRSFPEVVHSTVFQQGAAPVKMTDDSDDLFVAQQPSISATPKPLPTPAQFTLSDTESRSPSPGLIKFNQPPPPTSSSLFNNLNPNAAPKNPFATITKPAADTNQAATNAPFAQSPAFSWSVTPPAQPPQPIKSVETTRPQPFTAPPPTSAAGNTSTIFGNASQPTITPQDAPKQTSSVFGATNNMFSSGPSITTKETATPLTKTDVNASTTGSASGFSLFPSTASPANNKQAPGPAPAPATTPSFFTTQTPKPAQAPAAPAAVAKPASPTPQRTFAPAPQPLPPVKAEPPRDLMADFTKWILLGDGGLMEDLQDGLVEALVHDAYEQYHQEEEERLKREEDERSWAEALKFRHHNLQVKYFYRWREISRRSAARRIGRNNREALKAYREAKAAEARAAKKRKEKEEQALKKKSTYPVSWLTELDKERATKRARRESMSLGTSRRSSNASEADALMASGIFRGMPNGREAAVDSVRDDDSIYDALVGVKISPNPTRQIMGPPAKPVKDSLQSVRDGRVLKPSPKQAWSKKAQQLAGIFQPKRQEDDLLSFRSSTSSRLGQSVRSVASGAKSTNFKDTNFTRYQSSSPRSSTERDRARSGPNSGLKTTYWLLRDRGLFATPTGHVLSERAPIPRSSSLQDLGSQYSGDGSEMGDYDDRVLEQDTAYRASLGITGAAQPRISNSPAGSPKRTSILNTARSPGQSVPGKGRVGGFSTSSLASYRQSHAAGRPSSIRSSSLRSVRHNTTNDHDDDNQDSHQHKSSGLSAMEQDIEETLRELKRVADEMDEDTSWYREQNRQMSESQDLGR